MFVHFSSNFVNYMFSLDISVPQIYMNINSLYICKLLLCCLWLEIFQMHQKYGDKNIFLLKSLLWVVHKWRHSLGGGDLGFCDTSTKVLDIKIMTKNATNHPFLNVFAWQSKDIDFKESVFFSLEKYLFRGHTLQLNRTEIEMTRNVYIMDLDKFNLTWWFEFSLKTIFATALAVLKNTTHFKNILSIHFQG